MNSIKQLSAIYVKHRTRISKVLYIYLLFSLLSSSVNLNIKQKIIRLYQRRKNILKKKAEDVGSLIRPESDEVVKINRGVKSLTDYLLQVGDAKVLKILIFQVLFIFAKIYLNFKLIDIDSRLVSSLFGKDYRQFSKLTFYWLLIGIPMSYLTSLSTYLTDTLSKTLIVNISSDLMNTYLSSSFSTAKDNLNALYKINHFSNKINDPHQRISVDIFEFCNNLSAIPSLILNPFLNLVVVSSKLFNYDQGSMTEATLFFGLVVNISTILIKVASPSFSKIANSYSQLESDFRQVHSSIINHFEQIALLRSWNRELYDADSYYFVLERFLRRNYRKFALYNFVKTFIIKYTWGAMGLSLCAFPVFKNHFQRLKPPLSKNKITKDFVQNRSLLMNSSNAMGELLSSKKNIDQIIGTSKRIIELKNTLMELTNEDDFSISGDGSVAGTVIHNNDVIQFKDVPLITPTGQLLCNPLNFTINHGDNLLIIGPNGSGKSSLFRLLSGLWPVKSGELTIPEYNSIFYLPQRPYLIKGKTNLIEQIIYPKSFHEFEVELTMPNSNAKKIYKDLIDILKILELDYLLKDNISAESEEGLTFDSLRFATDDSDSESSDEEGYNYHSMISVLLMVQDWSQQLSLGSQQKLVMARLYYHKPKFAVLDECTSQVTPEMENKMYTYATKHLKISVLSVAHRTSIWKFHQYLLQFDGKGGYIFKKFNYKKRMQFTEEKFEIEKNLNHLPNLKARLTELKIVKENQLKRA
ncbi:ATP-binding cassette long-chain fatty acid transporter [Saccharomycopsis crataegensis]|uniref:ATP-binding cassette long-chain fatty acid transporter n=1 Tax=Saccharomycopsis crataegensis TaxID=43959 RepID=A0AAV5QPF0_9ASCO|nr:ATP-binding cassette long-chain fatty acid transporter [Saccharomycopsis crataegensis]